jgi:cytochrome c5
MNVTGQQVVAVAGFIVSCLLIVLAAGCSPQKHAINDPEQKHIKVESSEQQAAEESSGKKVFVANQFCSACHYGFMDEELARTHELAGIGCERCHGESERHRSDENNATPPQIMYPESRINPTCMMCHPRHEISHVASHRKLLSGARTVFDSAEQQDSQTYCTDCHAKGHHVNVRTIRWNKETGELIED